VICPAESFDESVYCEAAVKDPAAEYTVVNKSPYEPEPDEALSKDRRDEEFVVGVNAVALVGFTPTDAYTDVAGAESNETPITMVSPAAAVEGKLITIGVFDLTPLVCAGIVPTAMLVGSSVFPSAIAGETEDKIPKPKAATVTSAMRLKVVFVDICFLSISQDQEFPELGFELIS
jgi:hypothetical protein